MKVVYRLLIVLTSLLLVACQSEERRAAENAALIDVVRNVELPEDQRIEAVESLLGRGVPWDTFDDAIVKSLGSGPRIRQRAMDVLADAGEPGLQTLLDALDNEEFKTMHLISALIHVGGTSPNVEKEMLARLSAWTPDSALPAIQVLLGLGKDQQVRETLQQGLQLPAAQTRANVAHLVGLLAEQGYELREALVEALGDPVWFVRYEAALALGRVAVDSPEALAALQALEDDPSERVREVARPSKVPPS